MNVTQLEKYNDIHNFLIQNRFIIGLVDNEIHHYYDGDFHIIYNVEDNEIDCFYLNDLLFELHYNELTVKELFKQLNKHLRWKIKIQ